MFSNALNINSVTCTSTHAASTSCFPSPDLLHQTDVHPDHNLDHLREPERVRLSGNALHAQSVRGALSSGAERAQAQAQPEGCGHRSHHVQQVQPKRWPEAQRRGKI